MLQNSSKDDEKIDENHRKTDGFLSFAGAALLEAHAAPGALDLSSVPGAHRAPRGAGEAAASWASKKTSLKTLKKQLKTVNLCETLRNASKSDRFRRAFRMRR